MRGGKEGKERVEKRRGEKRREEERRERVRERERLTIRPMSVCT